MKKLLIGLLAMLFVLSLASCSISAPSDDDIGVQNKDSFAELPPEDGTTPEEYGSIENLKFVAGKLAGADNYCSVTEGKAEAGVLGIPYKQIIHNRKDYLDGKVVTLACSTSAFVNIAEEKYFAPDRVLLRRQKDRSKINGDATVFDEEAPAGLSMEEYGRRYGLVPTGLVDYILNEETLISASETERSGDLYTVKTALNPTKSTLYYRRQVKTMAASGNYPVFAEVGLDFTFDAEWRILKIEVREVYDIDMLGGVTCTGNMTITYSYGTADPDAFGWYEHFLDADVADDEEQELTAAAALADGFTDVITGAQAVRLDVEAGESQYNAFARLDVEGGFFELKIGSFAAAYKDGSVYFPAGGTTYSVNAKALAEQFPAGGEQPALPDTDELLSALAGGAFEYDKENGSATLTAELPLFETTVPLRMEFAVNDGKCRISHVFATFDYNGLPVSLTLSAVSCDGLFYPFDFENAVDLTPAAEHLASIFTGDVISASFAFALDVDAVHAEVAGSLHIDIPSSSAAIEAAVTVDEYTYNVKAVLTGDKLYADIDGCKYMFGGSDADIVRDFINDIKSGVNSGEEGGEALPEIPAGTPAVDLASVLDGVYSVFENWDASVLDFAAAAEDFAIRLAATVENPLSFTVNDVAVSILYARVSFDAQPYDYTVSEQEYLDMTTVVALASTLADYVGGAVDEQGASVAFTGSVNLNITLGGLDLIKIPVAVSAEGLVRADGTYDVIATVSAKSYYLGGLTYTLSTPVILGNVESRITVSEGRVFIARHITTERVEDKKVFGKVFSYKEVECDRTEYMNASFAYVGAEYMQVVGFALNMSDSLLGKIDSAIQSSSGKEEPPAQTDKFVMSNYLKDYAYADGTWTVVLSGAGLTGDKNIGDITLVFASEEGALSAVSVSCSMVGVVTVSASLTPTPPSDRETLAATARALKEEVLASSTPALDTEAEQEAPAA